MKTILMLDKEDLREVLKEFFPVQAQVEETPSERLLTSSEACEFLRCSKPTLHRWKSEGTVPHVRIGSNIRYRESDLKKLIEARK